MQTQSPNPPVEIAVDAGEQSDHSTHAPVATSAMRRWRAVLLGNRRTVGSLLITTVASGALLILLLVRMQAAASGISATAASPLIGRHAPDFTIQTWTWDDSPSVPIHLASLRGHPMVINFWASWCVACREEEPLLEATWLKYKTQGVLFIGVAFEDTPQDGTAFLQAYTVTFPSGPDTTGSIAINYGVTGVPETVFIDRQGVVRQKVIGALDARGLPQSIQQLLHEP